MALPISAFSSKTSITEPGCIPRSGTNPRLSSKPNSANSKTSERTQPRLCHSNTVSQPKGAVHICVTGMPGVRYRRDVDISHMDAVGRESPQHVGPLAGSGIRGLAQPEMAPPTRSPARAHSLRSGFTRFQGVAAAFPADGHAEGRSLAHHPPSKRASRRREFRPKSSKARRNRGRGADWSFRSPENPFAAGRYSKYCCIIVKSVTTSTILFSFSLNCIGTK